MRSQNTDDLWAMSSVALYSTGHWIGGTVCLVIFLAVTFS